MKLSIIVPVYNVEKYLDRCVTSIVNQTYKDIEIILIDDGSPDSSPQMCDEWAKKDSRIVVVHKQNGGLSSARNAGLRIAKGEYIGFVDSDDFVHEKYFETMINGIELKDFDFIKSNFIRFKNTKEINMISNNSFNITIYNKISAIDNFINTPFSNEKHMKSTVWDGVYKKELFNNIGFPEGKINEDTYIFVDLILNSNKIGHIDCYYYYYYQNEKGITSYQLNESKINSRDLWKAIHFKLKECTEKYNSFTAEMWCRRYLGLLNEIYMDQKFKQKYYSIVLNELLNDEKYLNKYIHDKRLKLAILKLRINNIFSNKLF